MSEARWQHGTKIHANFCGFATFRTTIYSGNRALSHPRYAGAAARSLISASNQLSRSFPQLTPLLEPSPGTRPLPASDDDSSLAEHIGSFFHCYCSFHTRDYLCKQFNKDFYSKLCFCIDFFYVVLLRLQHCELICVIKIMLLYESCRSCTAFEIEISGLISYMLLQYKEICALGIVSKICIPWRTIHAVFVI